MDVFHAGAKTPDAIDRLVSEAVRANINRLIVQVRRRGDAYHNGPRLAMHLSPSLPCA